MQAPAIECRDVTALTTARLAESDFKVGRAISQITTTSTRNFLLLFIVNVVTGLPVLLLANEAALVGWFLSLVLIIVSQAMTMHAAFQDLRGRQVHFGESLGVGLQRFFPTIGLYLVIVFPVRRHDTLEHARGLGHRNGRGARRPGCDRRLVPGYGGLRGRAAGAAGESRSRLAIDQGPPLEDFRPDAPAHRYQHRDRPVDPNDPCRRRRRHAGNDRRPDLDRHLGCGTSPSP